jgi:V-type H+-transporting ATPase subunit H
MYQNLETETGSLLVGKVVQNSFIDTIESTTQQVLSMKIPWNRYEKGNMINSRELELITKFDKKTEEERKEIMEKEGEIYAELFLELLLKTNKEETFQYLLSLIDKVLNDYPKSIKLFLNLSTKKPEFPFDPLFRILNRSSCDWFTNAKTSSILSILMSSSSNIPDQNIKSMCQWLRSQLKSNDERDISNTVFVLTKFLSRDEFRPLFIAEDGLLLLSDLLKSKAKECQLLYYTLYDIWMLTYNKDVVSQIGPSKRVIPNIVEILRTQSKEKIIRMSLAILVNTLNVGYNNEQMLDGGIMKILELLSNKNWGDEDIVSDIKTLKEALEINIVELSSFEIYKKEVISGNLDWTPVHKSEKFWKENCTKFEEDNFKILNFLKQYLSAEVPNPLVTSIACYDIGEFARIHPRGRTIIQQLNIKLPLMMLMDDKDPEVKRQALTAVQKLMVQNWEFLL